MGNLFYKDPSSQGATVGVQLHGNCSWNVVANNVSSPLLMNHGLLSVLNCYFTLPWSVLMRE